MEEVDRFEVQHSRMDDQFIFSCSGELDTVARTVRDQGLASYEAPLTSILIEIVKQSDGIFMDVGANTGLYSLVGAAASRSTSVIAFEPLGSVRELLQRNVSLNPTLAPRIAIEPVGLSSHSGTFSFYETVNDKGFVSTSSSLEQSHAAQASTECIERTIRTITLDEFGATLSRRISFMKVDVEGHEHAVIAGGRQFLAKHRPVLSIEVLNGVNTGPIDTLLVEADYALLAMAPHAMRHAQRAMFFGDAWNHLLVPAERLGLVFFLCRSLGLAIEFV